MHNYTEKTSRPTNEFKLAAFDSEGKIVWPPGATEPYRGTIKGHKAKSELFGFDYIAPEASKDAEMKPAGTGVPLWKTESLKNGDYLSTVNYWKSVGGTKFLGVDGFENTIPNNLLARDFWSADHFDKQVKCCVTDLANILSKCQDCIF